MALNQDCADVLAQNAARRLGLEIQYNYPEGVRDDQIDIQAALIGSEVVVNERATGFSDESFLATLNELDRGQIYAVRTGTNNGAGHYRLVYFEDGCWVSYSSETNYHDITDRATGLLTPEGSGEFIVPNRDRWGREVGQYSFQIIPMTMDVIKRVANYVYTCRVEGEDAALAQAFDAPQTEFRVGIITTTRGASAGPSSAPAAPPAGSAAASVGTSSETLFGRGHGDRASRQHTLPAEPPGGMSPEAYETFKQLYNTTPDILSAISSTLPTLIRETTTEYEREITINGVSINNLLHDKCDDETKIALSSLIGSAAGPRSA